MTDLDRLREGINKADDKILDFLAQMDANSKEGIPDQIPENILKELIAIAEREGLRTDFVLELYTTIFVDFRDRQKSVFVNGSAGDQDREFIKTLSGRQVISQQVAEAKRQIGKPVFDQAREDSIRKRLTDSSKNPELTDKIYTIIFKESRRLQHELLGSQETAEEAKI